MITKSIIGDITKTELKYISHGVSLNPRNLSSVGKSIFSEYPDVKAQYLASSRNFKHIPPDLTLGILHGVAIPPNRYSIYTMFTQVRGTKDESLTINYKSIASCFEKLVLSKPVSPVAIPKYGWGILNTEWADFENLINNIVKDRIEIWVYEF